MYIHGTPVGFVYFASELHAVYLHMGQIHLLQIFHVGMHNACLDSIYVFCLSFMCMPHIILACVHFACMLHILYLYVTITYHLCYDACACVGVDILWFPGQGFCE